MIVRMSKYQFVLYAGECENFVERLRDLGMVDISTSGWEPNEGDRSLMMSIEAHQRAEKALAEFAESESFDITAEAYASGEEAFAAYEELRTKIAEIDSKISELEKMADEADPWGDFSGEMLSKLESEGLKLNYFVANKSAYESIVDERGDDLTIVPIDDDDGKVYFVVVTRSGDAVDLNMDAQSLKPLVCSEDEAEDQIEDLEREKRATDGDMSRVAASLSLISKAKGAEVEKLQLSRVSCSAEEAAEGSLLVMEAWAEEDQAAVVDAALDGQDGLFYIKSRPTPEDNTPVKLKNNRYARLFELIGNLYALPKYGTIDLTPFFAPFYMMFFAICLCDAGYGAIILGAGVGLYFKGGESMRQASWFSMLCGVTAVIFGFFANSFFGMSISSLPVFEGFKFIDFQKDFFSVSMIIGIIQILFGMLINIVVTTRSFGFKYALGSLGWFIIVFSAVVSAVLSEVGVDGFGFDSMLFYIAEGIGLALLLLFNSPENNIFANLGSGLWQAYDRATGLLGDVLSYIRLFAIGLSGGVLALVFNDLAIGLSGLGEGIEGDSIVSIVMKVIAASMILLVGHGINLFMSTISSFVHPMRLTFVEFYKNAGFEMSSRKFDPLKREE